MLDRLIAASPYAGLYLALCLGGVGFPIPEEVPVLTAGVLAHRGAVRWWLALLVCIAGVVTGDLVLYLTGRHWGERVLDLRLVRRFLDVERRNALEASYRRYGMLIVFAARHVVGLRAAAFVTAGVVRLPFWKFAVADGVAIAYGIPLNFAIAYFFTAHLHAILGDLRRVESWLALVLLVGGGGLGECHPVATEPPPAPGRRWLSGESRRALTRGRAPSLPPRWRTALGAIPVGGHRGSGVAPPDLDQCDRRTGTVIERRISRVAPPSTSSRRRECP